VRAVNDPNAIPVRLTRDAALASGSFVHEEVSSGLFDEINNVIDVNRILAMGEKDFFLGPRVYHRIYAERHHVRQAEESLALLFRNGTVDFYAPVYFWATILPAKFIAQTITELYLYPTNRHGQNLTRISLLLGQDFSNWLFGKWHERWKGQPQPPSFYWRLKQTVSDWKGTDTRLLATRFSPTTSVLVEGEQQVYVKELLDKPDQASTLLSRACMKVFHGDKNYRSVARDLDYLAYGSEIQRRASDIFKIVKMSIGDRKAMDFVEKTEKEE
jgi:hypothetical protein